MHKNLKIVLLSFLSIFLFSNVGSAQEKIQWLTIEEAEAATKSEPKKIYVDFYTSWCGPCKMMSSKTFKNPEVIAYMKAHFYAVKFNAEGKDPVKFSGYDFTNPNYVEGKSGRNAQHQFAGALKVNAYPTSTFFSSEIQHLGNAPGYYDAPKFLQLLKYINEEAYIGGLSFDEYAAGKTAPSTPETPATPSNK